MALVPGSYVVVVRVGFIKIRTRFKKRQKNVQFLWNDKTWSNINWAD